MMPDFLLPADEAVRLRSLREAVFDELVRLTAQVFSLSTSLIALVDAEEAIYIASQGLAGTDRQSRVEALCLLKAGGSLAYVRKR